MTERKKKTPPHGREAADVFLLPAHCCYLGKRDGKVRLITFGNRRLVLEASEMLFVMAKPRWHASYMALPVKERVIRSLIAGNWKMPSKFQKAHGGPVGCSVQNVHLPAVSSII